MLICQDEYILRKNLHKRFKTKPLHLKGASFWDQSWNRWAEYMQKTVLHPQFLHMVGEEFGVFSRLENPSSLGKRTPPRLGGGGVLPGSKPPKTEI